jgi:hypothetical protein
MPPVDKQAPPNVISSGLTQTDSARLNVFMQIKHSVQRDNPNRQRCPNVSTRTHFSLIFGVEIRRPEHRACPSCPPRAQPTKADCLIFPLPPGRRAPPAQTPTMEMDAAAATSTALLLRARSRRGTARLHERVLPRTCPTRPTCSAKCECSPWATKYCPVLVLMSIRTV